MVVAPDSNRVPFCSGWLFSQPNRIFFIFSIVKMIVTCTFKQVNVFRIHESDFPLYAKTPTDFSVNAIKFSGENSDVQIVLRQQADGFALQVMDQGSGIREEDLPYIFDRFYTTTDTANPHGTGLGLSIAKEIAQRHHARISASNRPEGGCMIEVLFPLMQC